MTKCTAYKIKHIKETSYSKSGYMMYIHSKKRQNHRFAISEMSSICIENEYRLHIGYSFSRAMVSTRFNKKNFDRLTQIINSKDHSIEIFCIGMTDFLNKIGIDYDYYKRK